MHEIEKSLPFGRLFLLGQLLLAEEPGYPLYPTKNRGDAAAIPVAKSVYLPGMSNDSSTEMRIKVCLQEAETYFDAYQFEKAEEFIHEALELARANQLQASEIDVLVGVHARQRTWQ